MGIKRKNVGQSGVFFPSLLSLYFILGAYKKKHRSIVGWTEDSWHGELILKIIEFDQF